MEFSRAMCLHYFECRFIEYSSSRTLWLINATGVKFYQMEKGCGAKDESD